MALRRRFAFAFVALIIPSSFACSPACGQAYLGQWGSSGSGPGKFAHQGLLGICASPTGNVYVADDRQVQCFNSQGSFVFAFADSSFGRQYHGIAADAFGNLLVADCGSSGVKKYSATGVLLHSYTGFPFFGPDGIAVNANGDFYTGGEWYSYFCYVHSAGDVVARIGSPGTGDGQFVAENDFAGFAVGKTGNVYVTDVYNRRVQVFSAAGAFLSKWGSYGYHQGQFDAPWGIAIDNAENVYVTDLTENRVQMFTANGAYITEWGTSGSGPGQFNLPRGITVDSAGNVYVADSGNFRVQKFGPVSTPSRPTSWGRLKSLFR